MLDKAARPLFMLVAMALLGIYLTACGSANHSTPTISTVANAQEHIQENRPFDSDKDTDGDRPDEDDNGKPAIPDRDNDGDSTTASARHDSDDSGVLGFGHVASDPDKREITTLVKRYYAAAAAEDGAKACSMIYSTYAEAVPEDYGTSPPGPAYARGTSCAAVVGQIFKHFHSQIAMRLPKLTVAQVRVKERRGLALLSFGKLSDHEIQVAREGHMWRIMALIDNELP